MDGAAQCYRREPDGPLQVSMWIPSDRRRIRKSLKTKDPAVTRQKATEVVLDAFAAQKAGLAVFSETLGYLIRAWESKRRA